MSFKSRAFTLVWAFFVVPISLAASLQSAKIGETESRLLKQAADGAEKFRKGDAWLTFKTRDGQPLSGVNVEIRQKTHDFLFGALLFGLVSHAGSEPYRAWVQSRVRLARDYFCAGKIYLAQVRNLRCRLAGFAYIARFEGVLDAITREGYILRPQYPECKGRVTMLKLVATVFSLAFNPFLPRTIAQPGP